MGDVPRPSPERIREDVQHLKDWISKEPHLPKIEDERWLRIFLHNNKYSLEKTKFKLENLYTLRTKLPHVLKNRDPTAPEILQARKAVTFAISDKVTKTGGFIYYYKFHDPSLLNFVDFTKRIFMVVDVVLLEYPQLSNHVTVVDCVGVQAQHILKTSLGAGLIAHIYDQAYSEKVRAIHLINAPSTVHLMTDVLKRYFSEKIGNRIYTHRPGSSVEGQYIDADVLSCDFGGKGSSLAKLEEYTQHLLEKHRKWFVQQDDLCSNESLRRKDGNEMEELKGSFRKLEMD